MVVVALFGVVVPGRLGAAATHLVCVLFVWLFLMCVGSSGKGVYDVVWLSVLFCSV